MGGFGGASAPISSSEKAQLLRSGTTGCRSDPAIPRLRRQTPRANEPAVGVGAIDDLLVVLHADGDMIFSGTPSGIGNRRTPPRSIGPDDVLVSEIEGIGALTTRFTARG